MHDAQRRHGARGRRVSSPVAALAVVASLAGTARGEPAAAPASSVGLHAEPQVFAGTLHGNFLIGLGLSMGLLVRVPGGMNVRIGPTVSTFKVGGRGGGSIGAELQVDRLVRSARLGGRLSIAHSGGVCAACGDGLWIEAGPRLRGGAGALGVDVLWVHGRDGEAFGVRAHAALGGKPGKALATTTTVGLGVVGLIFVVGYALTTT